MNLSSLIGTIMMLFTLVTHKPQVLGVTTVASPAPHVLASVDYSLNDRYHNKFVNDVFADNILLTLSYMSGQTKDGQKVDWTKVRQPTQFQFDLAPGKTFAFHDQILPQYKDSVTQTTNSHFDSTQGFESDNYLVGDGVCHFASFINVVSKEAGLLVNAPTRHDFAAIPDVSRDNGTAIYYVPGDFASSSRQNIYVTNNTGKPIAFVFNHTSDNSLKIAIEQLD